MHNAVGVATTKEFTSANPSHCRAANANALSVAGASLTRLRCVRLLDELLELLHRDGLLQLGLLRLLDNLHSAQRSSGQLRLRHLLHLTQS